jgi:hypothetical protein
MFLFQVSYCIKRPVKIMQFHVYVFILLIGNFLFCKEIMFEGALKFGLNIV